MILLPALGSCCVLWAVSWSLEGACSRVVDKKNGTWELHVHPRHPFQVLIPTYILAVDSEIKLGYKVKYNGTIP